MGPDLSLMVILDALSRLGSVSRAADRLSLRPPAISHALNRLRVATGVPLFTRRCRGLVPTPHALVQGERAAGIVAEGQACLRPQGFDPSRDAVRFRLGVRGFAGLVLVPQIVAAMMTEARHATMDTQPLGPGLLRQLEDGELDLSYWGTDPVVAPFRHLPLFEDDHRLVLRRDHPALVAGDGRITLEDCVGLVHAVCRLAIPGPVPSTWRGRVWGRSGGLCWRHRA